jgi:hypothetical protein
MVDLTGFLKPKGGSNIFMTATPAAAAAAKPLIPAQFQPTNTQQTPAVQTPIQTSTQQAMAYAYLNRGGFGIKVKKQKGKRTKKHTLNLGNIIKEI